MANLEDLKQVLKETLENRGVLGGIRAQVRAEIFNALEEEDLPKAPLSNENIIINDLIREYLEFNKYKHTLSVLLPESGQPSVPLNHAFLSQELGVLEDSSSRQVPLLYSIVAGLQNAKRDGNHRTLVAPPREESSHASRQPHDGASRMGFTAGSIDPHEPRPLILRQ